MAMRTVPPSAATARAPRRRPGVPLFNFADPSGLVTQAMRMAGYDQVIGICDTPSSTGLRMADALGIDAAALQTSLGRPEPPFVDIPRGARRARHPARALDARLSCTASPS